MPIATSLPDDPRFDLICVGSGFASTFFLVDYLRRAGPRARVLVLERGRHNSHEWQIENRRNSHIDWNDAYVRQGDPKKDWRFTIGFGGGSNCWFGQTPRMMPSDFRMKSLYGVGEDWPLSYEDLEPFYQEAEEIMMVAGSSEDSPFKRSGPYPQPPHRFNGADRLLKQAYPNHHFAMPTVRARVDTRNRPPCCANGVCDLCPVDAKFTIQNELMGLFEDPRVALLLEAEALEVETRGNTATGVRYRFQGREHLAEGDLVVVGANALFSPFLLMRSGIRHPRLGRRLYEAASLRAEIFLDGVDCFDGSTLTTGLNYAAYEGPHRRERGTFTIETWNLGPLRVDYGKWRSVLHVYITIEDLPQEQNRVVLSTEDPSKPVAVFEGYSPYLHRGVEAVKAEVPRIMARLPLEKVTFRDKLGQNGGHIQGTVMMGDDPETSVVDRHLIHHTLRNLLVLGASAFPTGPCANPTLTLCALSLWSARHVMTS